MGELMEYASMFVFVATVFLVSLLLGCLVSGMLFLVLLFVGEGDKVPARKTYTRGVGRDV